MTLPFIFTPSDRFLMSDTTRIIFRISSDGVCKFSDGPLSCDDTTALEDFIAEIVRENTRLKQNIQSAKMILNNS